MASERYYIPELRSNREREDEKKLFSKEIFTEKLKNNSEIYFFKSLNENLIKEKYYIDDSKKRLREDSSDERFSAISELLSRYTEIPTIERSRGSETKIEYLPELGEIFRPFVHQTDTAVADIPLPTPTTPVLTPEERARLALLRRVEKLRSPHLQALLKFVRATPHLWDQIQGFQQRKDMMLQKTSEPGENHRLFAPLLAGMAVTPEARAYLQISLDEAAKQESDAIKAAAEANGGYYAPVLIIGAGIHGAIFNAQLLNDRPDLQALTVDKDTRLGGTFRKPEGKVFRTNSRNRAEDRTIDGLPGTDGNINSLGQYATMQISDMSSEVYADNDTFGLATALNQYLSGNTMLGVEVTSVEKNKRGEQGKYKVRLEDTGLDQELTVTTDVIVVASGLGERKYGLDENDTETAQGIVDNFELALATGQMPKIIPYDIFLELVGDRRIQFPLEPFINKRIAVVGNKDASNTTIEYLLGLGSDYRGSVAQMGKPQQIAWYGPEFKTQAEYKECTRARYAELGLFLPRVKGEKAPVQPVAERVNRLRQTEEGKITVLTNIKNYPERADDFDFVILATGFEDQKAKVFTQLYSGSNFDNGLANVESRDRKGNRVTVARRIQGESVYFVGPSANISVESGERSAVAAIEIPENSVAIWRYSQRTATTARQLAVSLPRNQDYELIKLGKKQMPEPEIDGQEDNGFEFNVSKNTADKMFPPEVNYANLLRIRALAQGTLRPSEDSESDILAITVESMGITEDGADYRFKATMDEGAKEHQVWMRRFLDDEVNKHLLARLTRTAPGRITVKMPVVEGKTTVDEIEVVRPRRTSK